MTDLVSLNDLEAKIQEEVLPPAPKFEVPEGVAHLGEQGEYAEKIIEAMLHDRSQILERAQAVANAIDAQVGEIRQRIRLHWEITNTELRSLKELDGHMAQGMHNYTTLLKKGAGNGQED